MAARTKNVRFTYVVCLNNGGYPASLELRKLYKSVPDRMARNNGLLRVIDESGEDYLFPADWFARVSMAPVVRRALAEVGQV